MISIFLFDINTYRKAWLSGLLVLLLLAIGMFAGNQFNVSVGNGVFLNSPYSIGYTTGMMSLSSIFIATVFAYQLLLKEWDHRFDAILFATAVSKINFVFGRFLSFFALTVFCFLLLMIGFAIGQGIRPGSEMQAGMNLLHYLYPFMLFGVINSLLVCSFLSLIAWTTRNKLLLAVGGLLLYVLYMVILLFSNSPFMAQALPQSLEAQQIAALVDPFGLSAYFWVSKDFSVVQRNEWLVPLSGHFLINRIAAVTLSGLMLAIAVKAFSFSGRRSRKSNKLLKEYAVVQQETIYYPTITTLAKRAKFQSLLSFVRIDLTYIFKTVPLILASIILLFAVGMEMYAEIEKGIRLPQKYASSGLMASTILENFHFLGLLLVTYFVNDMYWRSHASRFFFIEDSTPLSGAKIFGHWLSAILLLSFFTVLCIALGLVFQYAYDYHSIDWNAYAAVCLFNTAPLILLAGFLLLLQRFVRNKYLALGLSLLVSISIAGPLSGKIIKTPLLQFFTGFRGTYSDFVGFGVYLNSFAQRLLFGASVVAVSWLLYLVYTNRKLKWLPALLMVVFASAGVFSATRFMQGYIPEDEEQEMIVAANYEKKYRSYEHLPQPTIIDVKTKIDLYPDEQSYNIQGIYVIKNLSVNAVQKLLINFDDNLALHKAVYHSAKESIDINDKVSELEFVHPLNPGDTAIIDFELSYHWSPVNEHQPFNVIIANGSFMRISRYYPQIGYQSQRELLDSIKRKQFGLEAATPIKKLEDTSSRRADFINLDMQISTAENQRAVGTGALVKEWKTDHRNYFHYKTTSPIPFRFALSSANYQIKSKQYKNVAIKVLYHPGHGENVDHLISNAQITLDYCQHYFGKLPFGSIAFAEVSSFTSGFAATAYPGVIFMTEDMVFHANIKADEQQDVINELAGHELAHLWWGGNQATPDDREGATMLTETLAMYTEMMLYKKMYGQEKMMERILVHQQIYEAGKGFSAEEPLYKVTAGSRHIAYSKGAIVMVRLSELIGEEKLNAALKNYLIAYGYPHPKPVSTDLIGEILKVADKKYHPEIIRIFMGV